MKHQQPKKRLLSHKQATPVIFRNRPPRPWLKRKTLPNIRDLASFKELHRRADDLIKDYIDKNRRDWQQLPLSTCHEMETAGPGGYFKVDHLHANNAESRIAFVEAADQQARMSPALSGPGPVFFVTLTPRDYALPEGEAAAFDTRRIQAWTRQALAGLDFVGMVEAALFTNVKLQLWQKGHTVSWHVHLLVWGTTYRRLARDLKAINGRHDSLVAGKPVAYSRHLRPGQVLSKLIYMLKAPQKQYHEFCPAGMVVDWKTGEIKPKRSRVQKDWLRTGNRVRMCRVMADRYLDRLLFGQGAGTVLCRDIRNEALRPFRVHQRHSPSVGSKSPRLRCHRQPVADRKSRLRSGG